MPLIQIYASAKMVDKQWSELHKLAQAMPGAVQAALKGIFNEDSILDDFEVRVTEGSRFDVGAGMLSAQVNLYTRPNRDPAQLERLGDAIGEEIKDEGLIVPEYVEVIMRYGAYVEPS